MGVIQRQATKQTMVNYGATGIAALSTIFVYPLAQEYYGLWLTLFGMASFFVPFASLGIGAVTIRFFPRFQDPQQDHQGFLPFLLGLGFLFFSVFCLLVFGLKDFILAGLSALLFNVSIIEAYLFPILVLTGILLFNNLLSAYISNFRRIVVPGILTQFWPKVALPCLILLAWSGFLTLPQYVTGLILMQGISFLGLLIYLGVLGELRLKPSLAIWRSGRLGEMAIFGLYGILGSLGTIFAFRIDHIMIALLASVSSTGIYGIAQFIGNSIEMPTRSLYAISAPIIAKAWEEDNRTEILNIYQKSSLHLLMLGLPIFGMIWLSLDNLFKITADYEGLSAAIWVVYLIGIGKLVDMACSVNGQIISYSRYFRFNLLAVLVLAVSNVLLNYHLIPQMGIVGAALASFTAITTFNVLRSFFVWIVWRMQPFSWRTAVVLLLAAASTGIAYLLPDFGIPVLDILQNSLIVLLIYLPLVLKMNLSREVNDLVLKLLKRVKR